MHDLSISMFVCKSSVSTYEKKNMKYDRWNIVAQPGHLCSGFFTFRSPRGDVRKHLRFCLDLRVKRGRILARIYMMLSHIPGAGREDPKHSEIFSGRRSGRMRFIIVCESFFASTSCQGKHSLRVGARFSVQPHFEGSSVNSGPWSVRCYRTGRMLLGG